MRNNYFGTLYLFELKKILKNKVAMITFLIMLIAAIIVGEGEMLMLKKESSLRRSKEE